MKNTASQYCKTLDNVTREELVNALHQALMQLNATAKHETLTLVDNRPAIAEASRIMAKAGHLGFPSPAKPKGDWHFERSSGYDGCRCTKCAEWVYLDSPLVCICDEIINPVSPAPVNPANIVTIDAVAKTGKSSTLAP